MNIIDFSELAPPRLRLELEALLGQVTGRRPQQQFEAVDAELVAHSARALSALASVLQIVRQNLPKSQWPTITVARGGRWVLKLDRRTRDVLNDILRIA